MSIKVKEFHRLIDNGRERVNVGVLNAKGKVVYDRYVDAAEWDADPEAVAAKIAEYLAAAPAAPTSKPAVNKGTVELTDKQISDKLKEQQ